MATDSTSAIMVNETSVIRLVFMTMTMTISTTMHVRIVMIVNQATSEVGDNMTIKKLEVAL